MTSTQVFRPKILFKNIILKSSKKKVLDDVSGYALQGELLALMGPSGDYFKLKYLGCGKTSLLNVISFRSELLGIERSCISGNVYLDGVILSKNDKRRIGYVMQHDIFYENLTLKETMNFYGQILLPKTMSNEHKNARIFELLDLFNLRKSLDTLIGGELLRGLSGGINKLFI
uniref:ABC transporter G family member 27 (Trinotate prediction) n=1 Tax=Henneguya salminicola TaxID=69463 RepID=A0A6G3MHX2_HENSL